MWSVLGQESSSSKFSFCSCKKERKRVVCAHFYISSLSKNKKSWKLLPTFVSHLARFNFVLANFKFSFSLHLVVDLLLFSSPKALYTNRGHSRLGSHSSFRVDRQIFITSAYKMAFNINQQRQSKRHKTKSIGSPVSHIYFLLPVEKRETLLASQLFLLLLGE